MSCSAATIRPPATPRARAAAGFTLLEVLVALTILAIAILGQSNLMVSSITTNSEARRLSAATALAESKLQQLMAAGYSALASAASAETLDETGTATASGGFTRTWTVTASTPVSGTATVLVTVSWHDNQGDTRQVQLLTVLGS